MPLQADHTLCRLLQAKEHVCEEQRGHLYLGGLVWQIRQREERSGSAMIADFANSALRLQSSGLLDFVRWINRWMILQHEAHRKTLAGEGNRNR